MSTQNNCWSSCFTYCTHRTWSQMASIIKRFYYGRDEDMKLFSCQTSDLPWYPWFGFLVLCAFNFDCMQKQALDAKTRIKGKYTEEFVYSVRKWRGFQRESVLWLFLFCAYLEEISRCMFSHNWHFSCRIVASMVYKMGL